MHKVNENTTNYMENSTETIDYMSAVQITLKFASETISKTIQNVRTLVIGHQSQLRTPH